MHTPPIVVYLLAVCVFTVFCYIQQVVVSDTVGFIQKLPPQLVAAFRSTLEHIESSTIILHVVDVSHPLAAAQSEAVCQVPGCPSPCICFTSVRSSNRTQAMPAAMACPRAPCWLA